MSGHSALYVGSVMHRRVRPRLHHFRYRAFWMLLDLDELESLSRRLSLLSYNRANLFSFRESDHGDGTDAPLRAQIERQLAGAGIDLAGGAIRVLCMPRTLGYCFNPLSVYFCHRIDGTLAAIIYQVHNTFGERHSYVVGVDGSAPVHRHRSCKQFYVSPFMDMEMRYDFRVTGPDDAVSVAIAVSGPEGAVLSAVLTGTRQPITDGTLLRAFLRVPAVTLKVIAAIHWEALRLWIKRIGLRRRPQPPEAPATIMPTPELPSSRHARP